WQAQYEVLQAESSTLQSENTRLQTENARLQTEIRALEAEQLAVSESNNLDGTWVNSRRNIISRNDTATIVLTFSGRNFTYEFTAIPLDSRISITRETTDGTFSLTDDSIEFIYSDGTIRSHPFSRTENTITIDRLQYVRQ
ncbi:MAG: bZIP transcription factor, partial [Defluviitaleaceae bacterium]|nr:bZIP transcription factor [Defluviitaleaceae bacterium]